MTAALAEAAFRTYRRALLRFLVQRLSDPSIAEDIAQDVFLRLLKATGRPITWEQAYVYRVAANIAYDIETKRRMDAVIFDSALAELAAQHIHSANLGEIDVEVEWLLARLPALKASMILLQKREGHTFAEIATELGVSIHTVKRYLRLAVKQCREVQT